jgi:hypothetical protein
MTHKAEKDAGIVDIINALEEIVELDVGYTGLCSQVCERLFDLERDSESIAMVYWKHNTQILFESWEHYSGKSEYPVPSTDQHGCARVTYNTAINLYSGEYGALRKSLANHIIIKLKEKLGE